MGVLALPETPFGLAEAEKEGVAPRSEESNKEESQPKQPETPVQRSPLPREPEQGTPTLMVQLGLLRAETDRYSSWDHPWPLLKLHPFSPSILLSSAFQKASRCPG